MIQIIILLQNHRPLLAVQALNMIYFKLIFVALLMSCAIWFILSISLIQVTIRINVSLTHSEPTTTSDADEVARCRITIGKVLDADVAWLVALINHLIRIRVIAIRIDDDASAVWLAFSIAFTKVITIISMNVWLRKK